MPEQIPIVLAHGRAAELEIAPTASRLWGDALVQGLRRVGSEYADRVRIEYAYFGGLWREDTGEPMPTFQSGGKTYTVEVAPKARVIEVPVGGEQAGITSMIADFIVGNTPEAMLEAALRQAIPDVFEYLGDLVRRNAANQIVIDACVRSEAPVLVGFSMGTIVGYDVLRKRTAGSNIRSFVTCGSPIGLAPIRDELLDDNDESPFPEGIERWMNIWNGDDVATGIRDAQLGALFPGGTIQSARAYGRRPSLTNPFAAHNALDYLSSLPMGLALHLALSASGR